MASPEPSSSPFQHIWDDAAKMAAGGVELAVIVSSSLSNANAQIEVDSLAAVPAHGRDFFSTLGKALAWAVLLDVCVLGLGSFGAGPLNAVRLIICVVALVWAVAFGTLAANQRVQRSRIHVAATSRTVVSRIAEEAAGLVWSAQIPGSWRPLGPPVELLPAPARTNRTTPDDTVAQRWLRRLGGSSEATVARVTDGTPEDLRRIVRQARGIPVVLFSPDGVFADGTPALADVQGIALFGLAGGNLLPSNVIASEIWAAYKDRATTEPPASAIHRHWEATQRARPFPAGSR